MGLSPAARSTALRCSICSCRTASCVTNEPAVDRWNERAICSWAVSTGNPFSASIWRKLDASSALVEISFARDSSKDVLLRALGAVASRGWLTSTRLDANGTLHPCNAPNCGGLTLEAQLGIASNSRAEPDLHGWEVKQFSVVDFTRFAPRSPITLFTPEPTAGVYATDGVIPFIRRWGYPDRRGRTDRLNVGGRFVAGKRSPRTGLTLQLVGYDSAKYLITDVAGGIALIDDADVVAASWPFTSLIAHWNTKHAQAAYVPSLSRENPRQYRYADTVFLGEGTDFSRFLRGVSESRVYYDPGIKLEQASGPNPKAHRRSQFRIAFRELKVLYSAFTQFPAP